MDTNDKVLTTLAKMSVTLENIEKHLVKINGSVGEHDDQIHDLDKRTELNAQDIDTLKKQPSATRAVILVGGIVGVISVAVGILLKFA